MDYDFLLSQHEKERILGQKCRNIFDSGIPQQDISNLVEDEIRRLNLSFEFHEKCMDILRKEYSYKEEKNQAKKMLISAYVRQKHQARKIRCNR